MMINPVFCRNCKQPIEEQDAICSHCGADQRPPAHRPAASPDPVGPAAPTVLPTTAAAPPAVPAAIPVASLGARRRDAILSLALLLIGIAMLAGVVILTMRKFAGRDEADSAQKLLVGTWRSDDGMLQIFLNADGTGGDSLGVTAAWRWRAAKGLLMFEGLPGAVESVPAHDLAYTLSADGQTLTLFRSEGDSIVLHRAATGAAVGGAGPGPTERAPAPPIESAQSSLKSLALALTMYSQDYDGYFPPMSNANAVHQALFPYVKNDRVFVDPQSGQPYMPNAALSGMKTPSGPAAPSLVIFYEFLPARDGKRGVAFADGHTDRVDETQWQQLKQQSGIP